MDFKLQSQRTRVVYFLSESRDCSSGVMQESVIGPILFVRYFSDVVDPFGGGRCSYSMLMMHSTTLSCLTPIAVNSTVCWNGERFGSIAFLLRNAISILHA